MVDISLLSIEYPASDILLATNHLNPGNLLGTGTYGSVYRGVLRDGTEVAVKVLDAVELSGFEEEIKVLSRFRHPNLVILLGFARSGNKRFLIYELLVGGDVYKKLKTEFPWNQRLPILLDAACGLSHLLNSQPRCYHRDIKTSNILLDRNGTAKMSDLGLSCLNSNSASSSMRVSQASGTVGYACPLYISKGLVSEASEVYSFGMVLLELLTGMPPARHSGRDANEIVYLVNHIGGDVKRVIGLLDRRAQWPLQIAQSLAELALQCASLFEASRPRFIEIVGRLRTLSAKAVSLSPSGSTLLNGPYQQTVNMNYSSPLPMPQLGNHRTVYAHARPTSPIQAAPPAFVDAGPSRPAPFRVHSVKPASSLSLEPGSDGVLLFGRQTASGLGLPAELLNMISREHIELTAVEHRIQIANRGRNQVEVEVLGLSPFLMVSGEQVSLMASGEFQIRFVIGVNDAAKYECFLALRVEMANRLPVARLEIVSRGPQEDPLEVYEGGTAFVESEDSPLFQVAHEPELFASGFSIKALYPSGISLCSVSKTNKSMKSFFLQAAERTHLDADDYVRINENLVFQFKVLQQGSAGAGSPPVRTGAGSPLSKYIVPDHEGERIAHSQLPPQSRFQHS